MMYTIIAALLVGGMFLGTIFALAFLALELFTDWTWPKVATLIAAEIALLCAACIVVILVLAKILSAM